MSEEWIKLDTRKMLQSISTPTPGVELNLLMSPYDLPNGVRGHFDGASGMFVIEFKYLGTEPLQVQPQDYFHFHVGKNSGRLYRIEVDVTSLGVGQVALKVNPARIADEIDELGQTRQHRIDNYNLTKTVISNRSEELFRDLALA